MITHDTPKPPEIPVHLWPGLRRYLLDHCSVGGFLTSLLEGDLDVAGMRADVISLAALPNLVTWLDEHAPPESHGTPERVAAWLKKGWRP